MLFSSRASGEIMNNRRCSVAEPPVIHEGVPAGLEIDQQSP
jgi:hypothetical protein